MPVVSDIQHVPSHQPKAYAAHAMQATWAWGYWLPDMSIRCFVGWHLRLSLGGMDCCDPLSTSFDPLSTALNPRLLLSPLVYCFHPSSTAFTPHLLDSCAAYKQPARTLSQCEQCSSGGGCFMVRPFTGAGSCHGWLKLHGPHVTDSAVLCGDEPGSSQWCKSNARCVGGELCLMQVWVCLCSCWGVCSSLRCRACCYCATAANCNQQLSKCA